MVAGVFNLILGNASDGMLRRKISEEIKIHDNSLHGRFNIYSRLLRECD